MAKSKNTIWWIIGTILIGILFYKYSGFFGLVQECGNDCRPIYQSFKGSCYKSCGVTNSDGTKITNCDTQGLVNYYNKNIPDVKLYSDSKCTQLLEYYTCTPNWKCDGWNSCAKSKNGVQTRNCRDMNNCGNNNNKPEIWRSCLNTNLNNKNIDNTKEVCVPNWKASNWGRCINRIKSRTITDRNNCGTNDEKPPTMKRCSSTFNIFEIFSTLPNPFIKYPNKKDNLPIVFQLIQTQRPLMGGLQLEMPLNGGWRSFCTIGAIVKYNGKDALLTAAHCVQKNNITLGKVTYIKQGTGTISNNFITDTTGNTDSALIFLNSGINGITTDAINNQITGFTEPKKGMAVYKIGRTTGLTFGVIQDIDYNIGLKAGKNGNKWPDDYKVEFEIKGINGNFVLGGDSGSAIITVSSPHKIVGIIQGGLDGNGYAFSIIDIKNNLGFDKKV